MRAKEAVTAAINLFHCGPIQAPWEPHYVTDYGEAWDTLVNYSSYKLAEKWGITLEIEEGNRQSSWAAMHIHMSESGSIIIIRAASPGTWLHELCHAAAYRVNPLFERGLTLEESAIEEVTAELATASLLYLWHPNLDGEFRHCQEGVEIYAREWSKRSSSQLCEAAREEAENRVALILETMESLV
jgi:hypothetical protein